jgi:hypothetical protein
MIKAMTIAVLLGVVGLSQAKAQALSFRLEIPAGARLESRVLKAAEKEGFDAYMWIETATRENIQLFVSLRDESGSFSKSPIYILNDGSADFANADQFTRGYVSTSMMKHGTLVHNIRPKTNQVSTWIGVPAKNGITTTIEYF